MLDEKERLSDKEYESIGRLLLELIAECPYVPDAVAQEPGGILYQSIGTKAFIGIYTLPGARYLKKYVSGNFTAQIDFQVAYKSFPETNQQRVDAQAAVDNIMSWLEGIAELPPLSGGRKIESVSVSNGAAYKNDTADDTGVTFVANATMKYYKKGE